MYQISVPSELTPTVGNAPATVLENIITTALFPDERDASAETGDLRRLGMNLDLAVSQVNAEFALVLRREVLIAEDCELD